MIDLYSINSSNGNHGMDIVVNITITRRCVHQSLDFCQGGVDRIESFVTFL